VPNPIIKIKARGKEVPPEVHPRSLHLQIRRQKVGWDVLWKEDPAQRMSHPLETLPSLGRTGEKLHS